MKILVIENFWVAGRKLKSFEILLLNTFSILPTLYARQLAAITPKKHSVEVVDERYSTINFEEKYDIVLINFNFSSVMRAYEIADTFRRKNIPVVLSGWYASAVPKEAKIHADSVLIGKGELSWLKLLDDFEKNNLKPFYQPTKYDNSVKIPPTNVDIPGFVITGAIEATRGCPYRCEFCPEAIVPGDSQYYARPVDEVIAEIKSMPQKTLMFYDNSLTINPDYSKSLFKKMKALNKKIFCNGNSDVLARDKELVRLSKEAGCVSWLVGFESVSQKTLDEIGKTSNRVEEYFQAVKNIHGHGMAVIGSFMFGFDSDTKDVFDETLKTIKELEIDVADFCILTPVIGTPVFNKLEKEGRILTKDWSKYDMKNVVFEPKNMTPEELLQGVRRMYAEFYSTSYTVKRVVKSLRLGLYPFFLVLARNAVANMNSKLLFTSKK
ncbi:MAG: B12-binding domain-containing radical SAM protein [Thermoplasmatales archaeon]|nr:B12-binding domain-containing radical SAM protein [Thermoplasmatales archaeon]